MNTFVEHIKEVPDYSAFDVVLVPTFADVNAFRRGHGYGRGLFAQTVTTFNGWVADLWELLGDGRQPIDSIQRQVALQRSFEEMRFGDDRVSPGFVGSAATCVREASGLKPFEDALVFCETGIGEGFDALSDREVEFLRGIARYKNVIKELGLIELGDILVELLKDPGTLFPKATSVLVSDAQPLTWQQSNFFEGCENLSVFVQHAEGEDGVRQSLASIEVRSAYVSGKYAQPAMVADIIRQVISDGRVVVCSKDPIGLYNSVSSRLAEEGVSCAVQASTSFSQTTFGRTLLSMFRCVHDKAWDPSCLSDVLISPFSGIGKADARKIDVALKQDRIASRESCLAALRAVSDTFSQLEEIVSDPEADILLGVFENMVLSHKGWTDAYKREQIATMVTFRKIAQSARAVGLNLSSCEYILLNCNFDVSHGNGPDARNLPQVLITSQRAASRIAPGEFATLIMCDMNSVDYPIADKDDSVSTLLKKVGLSPTDSALKRARRDFYALQNVPAKRIVFERAMHDENAEETYRSAMLEEFFDAYRVGVLDEETIDEVGSNEDDVAPSFGERGEELLYANAESLPREVLQETFATVDVETCERISDELKPFVMAVRTWGDSGIMFGPSPSQIELYLECPYQWFVSRRLKIEAIGESLGPLEKGLFAHEALETFYKKFIAEGFAKVSFANIVRAKELMSEVLSELAVDQVNRDPGSGRLVATSQIEAREIESFKQQLIDYLDFEAELLPTFSPRYFEYQIGEENRASYAGYDLLGKIDRIDVDENGNAVIIDYKGSITDEHSISEKSDGHAGKVQTRIYAQAIRRQLGLNVVGAFYVSYGRHHAISGAYDSLVLDVAHLPGINPKSCACATHDPQAGQEEAEGPLKYSDYTFKTMLDKTEEMVSRAILSMDQGIIAANPSSGNACSYCPVVNCAKRGA